MRKEVQIRFHNIISKPALSYGNECWTLRQKEINRINASQMRFLRSLTGVTLRGRIRSEDIRNQWEVEEMTADVQHYQNGKQPKTVYWQKKKKKKNIITITIIIIIIIIEIMTGSATKVILYFTYLLVKVHTHLSPPGIDVTSESRLSSLVIDISYLYFKQDFPIVIQTPNMWNSFFKNRFHRRFEDNNFGNELLQNFHEACTHTVIVAGYVHNFEFIDNVIMKPGYAIIFIGQGDRQILTSNIIYMAARIRKDMRNPRIRVLIITTTAVESRNQQIHLAKYLLNIAWNILRSLNTVVGIPNVDSNSNLLDLFSFFPEEQTYPCLKYVEKISYIDTWFSTDREFVSNATLYPFKEITDMKGCFINMEVNEYAPYVSMSNDEVNGVLVEVVNTAAMATNYSIVCYYEDSNREFEMTGAYRYELLDNKLQTLYPYFIEEITWFVPSGDKIPLWQAPIRIFNFHMWILVALSFFMGSLTFWLIHNFENGSFTNQIGTTEVIMNTLKSYLGTGMQEFSNVRKSRLYLSLWLFFCLHIYTAYQSALITFLFSPGYFPPIKDVEELNNSGINLGSIFEDDIVTSEYLPCNSLCLHRVAYDRDLALLAPRFLITLVVNSYYTDEEGPRAVPLNENVMYHYASIYFKFDSIIVDRVNSIHRRLFSAGKILRKRLRFDPYRLQLLQALKPEDKVLRRNFCINMYTLIEYVDEFLCSVVFSNEDMFHLSEFGRLRLKPTYDAGFQLFVIVKALRAKPRLHVHEEMTWLGSKRFDDDEELKTSVVSWLQSQAAEFYDCGISKLVRRYDKCLNVTGNYVEK
ncbi:hypothetical protein ANN_16115 [Periplaneta americana]|uniref:Ionotropic glutamate receptor C-terminal domain-containing protein n=1 Tax=Periplaneta americana TaxID=6978 RepID=A0ABQ8SID0_PERAM|nr:hypothetical protein ANN_16115 [Periplaneta americana]